MVKTIGNPISWASSAVGDAGNALVDGTDSIGSHSTDIPEVRRLTIDDIMVALYRGTEDFARFRTDVIMLVLLYPVIGLTLVMMAYNQNLLPLIFPVATGFALIGPLAAVGLYEMSRQRETGADPKWSAALNVFRPAVIAPVLALGLGMIGLYAVWIYSAAMIYEATMGPGGPLTMMSFIERAVSTPEG